MYGNPRKILRQTTMANFHLILLHTKNARREFSKKDFLVKLLGKT